MKPLIRFLASLAAVASPSVAFLAQTSPLPAGAADKSDVVTLSPFEVTAASARGYAASNTLGEPQTWQFTNTLEF
jgi:hypothetical protein